MIEVSSGAAAQSKRGLQSVALVIVAIVLLFIIGAALVPTGVVQKDLLTEPESGKQQLGGGSREAAPENKPWPGGRSKEAAYRLVATEYDDGGNSNSASVCNFTVSGWSDCVSKTSEHYTLKPESIATFTRIVAGAEAPYNLPNRPVPDDDAFQWHDMVIAEAVAEGYRLVRTWVSPVRSTGRYILYDLLTGSGPGR